MIGLMSRRKAGILAGLGVSALLAKPAAAAPATGPRAANRERDLLEIDPEKFRRPLAGDNRWMPLTPGKQLVYEGWTQEGRRRIPHRVTYTVTDLVKTINGIPCAVVHDVDVSDGQVQELELTFFAQDDEGNVWHLGQLREAYEEQDLIGGQAWMVGHLADAKAGIMMPANPREGTPSFSEGYAPPPWNWTDRGRVRKTGERTTVPAGTFDNLLVIEETSDSEAGAFQLKYYAQGVGVVRVGWAGNDATKETLQLVRHVQLGAKEMDQLRADALKLEERAYLYGRTQPAERRTG